MKKMRLHTYLTNRIREKKLEYTRAEIQRNIEEYGVCINGQRTFGRLTWVHPLDSVQFEHWPQRQAASMDKIKVLLQNDSVIALFKPKNIVVQPGAGHQHDSLLSWLLTTFPEQKDMLQAPTHTYDNHTITAGLVHRLDKNTQGVLLVARSIEDLRYFQAQFRNRTTQKYYLALLDGVLESRVEVRQWQIRDPHNPRRQRAFWSQEEVGRYSDVARASHSIIRPQCICTESGQTVVEVEIKTGRMHQIRLHCESIGFPLFAEEIYTQADTAGLQKALSHPVTVPNISRAQLQKYATKTWGEYGYSLLSHRIVIQQKDGTYLDIDSGADTKNFYII